MLAFIRALKQRFSLKMAAVSNEGREITAYRIDAFKLRDFIDAFVISSHPLPRPPRPAARLADARRRSRAI